MKEPQLAREQSMSDGRNSVSGATRTVGGVTEQGYSAPLKRAILSYEHQQRQEKNEAMAFYDDEGNLLSRKEGKRDRVEINKEDVPRENLIMTHNHPSALSESGYMRIGNSFSMEDAIMAVRHKAKEVRAVTPTYTFSIKRKGDKWGVTQAAVRRAYEKAINQVATQGQSYSDRIGFSQTVNNRYTVTFWHKVNKLVAKELGWDYSKKRG